MVNIKSEGPRKALLVIDIQEDYTGPSARKPFPYKDSDKLIAVVNGLIEEAAGNDIFVVYIRQEFDGFGGRLFSKLFAHSTAMKGNPGTELDKRINIVSEHVFSKPAPDGFKNPRLNEFLRENNVNELYLTGLDAAGCVHFSAKGALKRGYKVSIIKDAVVTLAGNQKLDKLCNTFSKEGINLITSKEL